MKDFEYQSEIIIALVHDVWFSGGVMCGLPGYDSALYLRSEYRFSMSTNERKHR
ncbi:MAG: hypothetical protein ACXQTE_00870 [Methanosarcinaceae archaeon]